eukprot:Colp12_sorted_trinity150504_noHs@34925
MAAPRKASDVETAGLAEAKVFFEKIGGYVQAELSGTCEDFKLLEQMNDMTAKKYEEMASLANSLNRSTEDLNSKYQELQPYLAQIDALDDSIKQLEQIATSVDSYSRRLEAKFKALERR